jgi:hypothetical protein
MIGGCDEYIVRGRRYINNLKCNAFKWVVSPVFLAACLAVGRHLYCKARWPSHFGVMMRSRFLNASLTALPYLPRSDVAASQAVSGDGGASTGSGAAEPVSATSGQQNGKAP